MGLNLVYMIILKSDDLPPSTTFHIRTLLKLGMAIFKHEFYLLVSVSSVEMTALSQANSTMP